MMTSESVQERLIASRPTSPSAGDVLEFLARREAQPVAGGPATITVSEALRLWRTRLKNTEHTKAPLQGVQDLLSQLEQMAPQRKVDQFGFIGPEIAVTVFFAHSGGSYIGSAMLDKRDLR